MFWTQSNLNAHECFVDKPLKHILPNNEEIKFKDHYKSISPPFVFYLDIECALVPAEDVRQRHVPLLVGVFVDVNLDIQDTPPYKDYYVFEGEDAVLQTCLWLDMACKELHQWAKEHCNVDMMELTIGQESAHVTATNCKYCGAYFSTDNKKVYHHNHMNGKYIAPACNTCNLKMQLRIDTFPIIAHNLKNYDLHLLLLQGFAKMKEWDLQVIPASSEKYISLTAKIAPIDQSHHLKLVFLDSYAFLPSSLAKLADNLNAEEIPYCKTISTEKESFPTPSSLQ